jgi:hypothetical protein
MRRIHLGLDEALYRRLHAHLLRQRSRNEQAAFLLCETTMGPEAALFACLDAMLVEHQQFAIHSAFHLELNDAMRARVIKAAHDRKCSLVEIHSHPWSGLAQFSASDFEGLAEFVPHVWWRLGHRPYGALIITPRGIDGLAWIEGPEHAERIDALHVGDQVQRMSGLSFLALTEVVNEAIRPQ